MIYLNREEAMNKRLLLAVVVLTGLCLLSASIVWAQDAPVAKTGQTTSYLTGDDGDLEKGVASPVPRFTDNGDGTVTDNLTGLMWAKDANPGAIWMTWSGAINFANGLTLGVSCGGEHTDWRLPNAKELQSLIDFENFAPALPTDHPFINVQSHFYWSSTTFADLADHAWWVSMSSGDMMFYYDKTNIGFVWPVRSDN
jgi:hypothetical protein